MKSLRLIRALVGALVDLFREVLRIRTRTTRTTSAPVFGPSGPWMRLHVAALPYHRTARAAHALRRPAPVRAPAHILAMLDAAPDVEPGLLRRALQPDPGVHPTVLAASDPPATEPARLTTRRRRLSPRTWIAGITLRVSRGCRAVAEWLVFDSPPDAKKHLCAACR